MIEYLLVMLVVFGVAIYIFSKSTTSQGTRQYEPPEIDWVAANDESVQQHLPKNKIQAIKAYRELTGVGLKEAKEAVEYAMDNPDAYDDAEVKKKAPSRDAGVRELVRQGKIDEAVDVYRDFTGASLMDAKADIAQIEQELSLEDYGDEDKDFTGNRR